MAIFTAFQATDMRRDLWPGIVVERGGFTIVATDGVRVASFDGRFAFPFLNDDLLGFLDPFGLGPVSGTLLRYDQSLGRLPQFTLDQLVVPAQPVFAALRFDKPGLASALALTGRDTLWDSRDGDLLTGFGGDDTMLGFGGADALLGGFGADVIYGGDGNDRLRGGADRDVMMGDAGADVLVGDAGPDRLSGGSGSDSFRYLRIADSPDGSSFRDSVRDFAHNADTIDLRPIDAVATASGNQAFDFIGGQPFSDTPGELRYTRAQHLLQGDTDGDGDADFEMDLTNAPKLDAGDLLL
jgi:Ca2+-binding RTX toxin-like protein